MKEDLDNIYLSAEEPQRGALLALRDIILSHNANISETIKYGMPCFLYKRNILCYLWVDKKTGEPYILMAEGNYLSDPALEKGARSRMKILRVNPYEDLPVDVIRTVLDEAVALYTENIVKLK